jgi:hypothetical protein
MRWFGAKERATLAANKAALASPVFTSVELIFWVQTAITWPFALLTTAEATEKLALTATSN